jgi:hypothetical protein
VSARLLRDQVAAHLASLRRTTALTSLQSTRLKAILDTLGDDGRFRLRDALDAAEFDGPDARAPDAFQDFRQKVNKTAAAAGVELTLELEARKAPGRRAPRRGSEPARASGSSARRRRPRRRWWSRT